MVLLAPSLARVLDVAERHAAGDVPAEAVLEAIPPALAFANEGLQLFRLLQSSILRTDEVEELVRQIQLEHDAQLKGLVELEQAVREKRQQGQRRAIQEVRSSSTRLLELFAQVQEKEHQEKVYSPYPALDQFIKTGINLLNGYLEPSQLEVRLPSVMGLTQGLKADVERFHLLYEKQALADQARTHLGQMEAGLGAALAWLQEKQKRQLEDSLKLLGSASVKLGELMKQFDQVATSQVRFSRQPYLEELGRALEGQRAGRFPEQLAQHAWQRVHQALGHYLVQLQNLESSPFRAELEDQVSRARALWEEARQKLEGADLKTLAVDSLEAPFANLSEQLATTWKRMAEDARRFEGAPHLAQLREMIGRALSGKVPPGELKSALDEYRTQHNQLLEQLQQGGDDPLTAELVQLLSAHGMAYTRMAMFFDDGDHEHLKQGWKLISITLDRVLQLSEQLRQRLGGGSSGGGPRPITCFRCGTQNHHELRHCKQCNAVLPKLTQEITSYTDVTGDGFGEQVASGPAHLVLLEALAEQAEAGQITREVVGREVDKLLEHGEKTRQAFQQRVIHMMGKDSTFDAYAQFFAIKMNGFIQGLQQMRTFADGGALSHLHSGLAVCRETGEELQLFQEQINRALGGGQR